MLQQKQYIKRSVMDRRSFRDRRILNLGSASFDLFRLEDGWVVPGFMPSHDGRSSLHTLLRDLQASKFELELQNKELLRSQQELMKFKICLTEIYDTAPVGDTTLDLKGVILNANLTLADMLSAERSTLLNQPFTDHIVFEDRTIYRQYLQDLNGLKIKQVCELRLQRKDGTPLAVQLQSILTKDCGKNLAQIRTVVIV